MVSNLRRFFYHPQKSQVLRHTLSSFDFGENVMPTQHSNIHTLDIYPPAYFIILKYLPSVSSPCLGDMSSFLTLSTSAISLFRCFSASFKARAILIILKIRNKCLCVRNVVMTFVREVVLAQGWHNHNNTQSFPFWLPIEKG